MPTSQVITAQAQAVHRELPTACATSLCGLVLDIYVLPNTVPFKLLLAMIVIQGGLNLIRLALWPAFRGIYWSEFAARRLLWLTTFFNLLDAFAWGANFMLFAPYMSENQWTFIFALVPTGALLSIFHSGTYLLAYLSRPLPVCLALAYLEVVSEMPKAMHVGALVFCAIIMLAAWLFNHRMVAMLQRTADNEEMLARLRTQTQRAETLATAKSRLLAAASHDLRQPMHALTLYLDALQRAAYPAGASAGVVLNNAKNCAHTMNQMFHSVLDISRLEGDTAPPSYQAFAIDGVLERLRLELLPQAAERGLALHVVPSSCWVYSDPELLERMLRNLVLNALQYTPRGKVLLGCRRRDHVIDVQVLDTGCGIAADQQALIFQEFYQVENAPRQPGQGLGLGLALVQRIAAALETELQLRSIPGRGSCFSVSLPRHASLHGLETGSDDVDIAAQLNGTCVLVLDDEPATRDACCLLLELWGCRVFAAASSETALALMRFHRMAPDAIVCDYHLRHEIGISVINRLRKQYGRAIPAVLVTGDITLERVRLTAETGIPVLHKPAPEHSLRQLLASLLAAEARSLMAEA